MDWISKQAKLYRKLALTHRYQAIVQVDFDMNEFIIAFSKVVYTPLLYLVHYSTDSNLNKQWNKTIFLICFIFMKPPILIFFCAVGTQPVSEIKNNSALIDKNIMFPLSVV